jgi:hypothetical protein
MVPIESLAFPECGGPSDDKAKAEEKGDDVDEDDDDDRSSDGKDSGSRSHIKGKTKSSHR